MTKAPDQAVYDYVFETAVDLGFATYTHLPPPGTEYPFCKPGEVMLLPRSTKTRLLGRVAQTVDIWGDYRDRKRVSDMANLLLQRLGKAERMGGYPCRMNYDATTTEILPDNSTGEDLWRARLQIEILLTGG